MVNPPSDVVPPSWSSAAPTPTPAPPKTSAARPAAAAGAIHPGRWRAEDWTGSEGDGSGYEPIGVGGLGAGAGAGAFPISPPRPKNPFLLLLLAPPLPVGQQERGLFLKQNQTARAGG